MNAAEFHREISARLEKGSAVAVATVIRTGGSSPGKVGQKIGMTAAGETFGTAGGGALEQAIVEDMKQVLAAGEPVVKQYSIKPKEEGGIGMLCGGEAEVMIERIGAAEQIVLIGGGHIAKIIYDLAQAMGIGVQVVDNRAEYASRERFGNAAAIHAVNPASPELKDIVPNGAPLVILTHSHDIDRDALRNVLSFATGYVGMIGSRRKVAAIFKKLEEEGVPREKLDAVRSPIGIEIGAQTPEEIALSILAEVVAYRRGAAPERGKKAPAAAKSKA
ncbi:MAG: XdhC family protein [Planctomycetota bacterium]